VVDHAAGSPFDVDAGGMELVKCLGVGLVTVECGVQNDFGVDPPGMRGDQRGSGQ
jgi:hypothetical protein